MTPADRSRTASSSAPGCRARTRGPPDSRIRSCGLLLAFIRDANTRPVRHRRLRLAGAPSGRRDLWTAVPRVPRGQRLVKFMVSRTFELPRHPSTARQSGSALRVAKKMDVAALPCSQAQDNSISTGEPQHCGEVKETLADRST